MRGSVQCALLSIKERTHFITIYCKTLKGFTSSWMGFISSWYLIRYRSDSFCTIAINLLNEIMFLIILLKLIMRGSVSCALLSIKQRTHFISIYCIHFKGFTLSWMGFIPSWYSICYRSDPFFMIAINLLNEIMFLIILIKLIMRGSVQCTLLSIKGRTHFISIYCIHFKG